MSLKTIERDSRGRRQKLLLTSRTYTLLIERGSKVVIHGNREGRISYWRLSGSDGVIAMGFTLRTAIANWRDKRVEAFCANYAEVV